MLLFTHFIQPSSLHSKFWKHWDLHALDSTKRTIHVAAHTAGLKRDTGHFQWSVSRPFRYQSRTPWTTCVMLRIWSKIHSKNQTANNWKRWARQYLTEVSVAGFLPPACLVMQRKAGLSACAEAVPVVTSTVAWWGALIVLLFEHLCW